MTRPKEKIVITWEQYSFLAAEIGRLRDEVERLRDEVERLKGGERPANWGDVIFRECDS